MDHVERRSYGAHEAARRPPAKPLRGAPSSGPSPLKVYCVEPRDFRELVQRLTGARTAAVVAPAPTTGGARRQMERVMPTPAAAAVSQNSGRVEAAGQFDYSPWLSAPLFSPAYAPAGFDGHHGAQGRL